MRRAGGHAMIIHGIEIEDNEILVGATTQGRWDDDRADGMNGADAKSLVWVTLKDNGPGWAVTEAAGFHCKGDPDRTQAMLAIKGLLEVAWIIKNEGLDRDTAIDQFFGTHYALYHARYLLTLS